MFLCLVWFVFELPEVYAMYLDNGCNYPSIVLLRLVLLRPLSNLIFKDLADLFRFWYVPIKMSKRLLGVQMLR